MPETIITCIIVVLMLSALSSIVIYSLRNGIPPMPTSRKVKQQLFDLLRQEKIQGNIFELGAGWGTLAFPLAKHYHDCKVFAYENSFIPYMFCRLLNLFLGYNNLTLYRKNFYDISLADADMVICYIYTVGMEKLKAKFECELKERALVISHTFAVPYWKPANQVEVNDLYRTKIYLYVAGQNL